MYVRACGKNFFPLATIKEDYRKGVKMGLRYMLSAYIFPQLNKLALFEEERFEAASGKM